MQASAYDFRRPEGGLAGLHDWLVARHVDELMATFVTDTLWFYYWYFLWPSARDVLPVEIGAASRETLEVFLTVPFEADGDGGRGVPETDISRLREEFVSEVARPLGEDIRGGIEFVAYPTMAVRLNEPVSAMLLETEQQYISVFVGDLLHDLRSFMPAEALEQWIDTPNTRFGGMAPRELLRSPDMRAVRDLILEARHGLPT